MQQFLFGKCNNNRLLQVMALTYYGDNLVNLRGWWMKTNTVFIYCDRYNTYLMIGKQRDWQAEVKGHDLWSSWGTTEGNEKLKCLRMIDVLRIISHAAKLQQREKKVKIKWKTYLSIAVKIVNLQWFETPVVFYELYLNFWDKNLKDTF